MAKKYVAIQSIDKPELMIDSPIFFYKYGYIRNEDDQLIVISADWI